MKRYLYKQILKDLSLKMVFLTGPRQVGKTTLAKQLQGEFKKPVYLNSDDSDDVAVIRGRHWPPSADLVILDEIHKEKGWKNFLKGTFDTRPSGQNFLVTGSARLDTFRQSGPSLAGRYFSYHLHPLSVKELTDAAGMKPLDALEALNRLGGFPEPFFSASQEQASRWRRQYFTDLVREDIMDFSRIQEIRVIRLLLELLRKRVGTPLSFAALAGDLQVAPNTVRKYVSILESLHVIFLLNPFHRNIARSLLKEPKAYFYDSAYVEGDEGIRLENTVAVCLKKHADFLRDTKGSETALGYLRTKDGREVDFALVNAGQLESMIEVKLTDRAPSRNLLYFKNRTPDVTALQLVMNARHDEEKQGIAVFRAAEWLAQLDA